MRVACCRWARFLAFAIGAVTAILFGLTFIFDDEFLFEELFWGRSVTWWLGVFGVALVGFKRCTRYLWWPCLVNAL
jgi:hypothetical protein